MKKIALFIDRAYIGSDGIITKPQGMSTEEFHAKLRNNPKLIPSASGARTKATNRLYHSFAPEEIIEVEVTIMEDWEL